MTLTFIPKIIAVIVALVMFGNFMLQKSLEYTGDLFTRLPDYVR